MTEQEFSAEEFAACRPELPEDGRWAELVAGRIVERDPPGETHGLIVLNLSRALSEWLQPQAAAPPCSPCFELGLLVQQNPDTVRFPAISFFPGNQAFDETGKTLTRSVPLLCIDVASTTRQAEQMPARAAEYLAMGVGTVWIFDIRDREVHVHSAGGDRRLVAGDSALLEAADILPGFQVPLGELFLLPRWWA